MRQSRSGFISPEREVSSGFCPDARHDEGAYSQKSVTEEQRSVRAKDTENAPPDLMKPLLSIITIYDHRHA